MKQTQREQSSKWIDFEKRYIKEWAVLFRSISQKTLDDFWLEFMSDLVDLFFSGVYKKIDPEPYFYFLTLPWSKEHRQKAEEEINWIFSCTKDSEDIQQIVERARKKHLLRE